MKEALNLSKKGFGRTSPNPAVGAVIVRDGEIIASGYHKKEGQNHAEVEALSDLKGDVLPNDTMYVTLEPCNHFGKTPPCTEAIIKKGLKKVVIGMMDPNPNVAGGGKAFLKENGVDVISGVLESECRKLNEAFIKHSSTGSPFIIAKSAQTMDGCIATKEGHSKWITNHESRAFVHELRDKVDAIMVGIGTILADDPLLTTRLEDQDGKDPVRVIIDTNLRIPNNANVLNLNSGSHTIIVVRDDISDDSIKKIEKNGVIVVKCPIHENKINLPALMKILGTMSMTSILLEGGSSLMGSMIREKLIDKFYIFKAPKLLGAGDGIPMAGGTGPQIMDHAFKLKDIEVRRFGDDLLITGYSDY